MKLKRKKKLELNAADCITSLRSCWYRLHWKSFDASQQSFERQQLKCWTKMRACSAGSLIKLLEKASFIQCRETRKKIFATFPETKAWNNLWKKFYVVDVLCYINCAAAWSRLLWFIWRRRYKIQSSSISLCWRLTSKFRHNFGNRWHRSSS